MSSAPCDNAAARPDTYIVPSPTAMKAVSRNLVNGGSPFYLQYVLYDGKMDLAPDIVKRLVGSMMFFSAPPPPLPQRPVPAQILGQSEIGQTIQNVSLQQQQQQQQQQQHSPPSSSMVDEVTQVRIPDVSTDMAGLLGQSRSTISLMVGDMQADIRASFYAPSVEGESDTDNNSDHASNVSGEDEDASGVAPINVLQSQEGQENQIRESQDLLERLGLSLELVSFGSGNNSRPITE